MKVIRVLLYKAKLDGHWIDDLINLWTWPWNMWAKGPYSHCEIWVPETGDIFQSCDYEPKEIGKLEKALGIELIKGTAYTSTMRGDYNGTVKRPASEVLTHPDRWDYVEIELSGIVYSNLLVFMGDACKRNKGYDKPALLKFFLPFGRHSAPDKYICSEFVQASLAIASVFDEYKLWSPRRLSRKLEKLGYKIHKLVPKKK